jgi:hypothetical protein
LKGHVSIDEGTNNETEPSIYKMSDRLKLNNCTKHSNHEICFCFVPHDHGFLWTNGRPNTRSRRRISLSLKMITPPSPNLSDHDLDHQLMLKAISNYRTTYGCRYHSMANCLKANIPIGARPRPILFCRSVVHRLPSRQSSHGV